MNIIQNINQTTPKETCDKNKNCPPSHILGKNPESSLDYSRNTDIQTTFRTTNT
jgi:hypothetical protein